MTAESLVKEGAFNVRKARKTELGALQFIDDKAGELYLEAGLNFDLQDNHPFLLAEAGRWQRSIDSGLTYVVEKEQGDLVGFAVLGFLDSEPYLDQLSVHPDEMRKGIGRTLLRLACEWAGDKPLWLTTYSHFAWNKPFYERYGFVKAREELIGVETKEILKEQRSALPEPDKRIVMVRAATCNSVSTG